MAALIRLLGGALTLGGFALASASCGQEGVPAHCGCGPTPRQFDPSGAAGAYRGPLTCMVE